MRTSTFFFMCLFALPCFANVEEDFRLSAITSISIVLEDEAKDGCWTNLRETREYVEEKLRSKGANLVPNYNAGDHDYRFNVSVLAYRAQGGCVATIKVSLYTILGFENTKGVKVYHVANAGEQIQLISGYPKANNVVLNLVREFIGEIKR